MNWRDRLARRVSHRSSGAPFRRPGCRRFILFENTELNRRCLKLYSHCGSPVFDDHGRLVSVRCPALLCGPVRVRDNRIQAHQTWNDYLCTWSGWRIVNDGRPQMRCAS